MTGNIMSCTCACIQVLAVVFISRVATRRIHAARGRDAADGDVEAVALIAGGSGHE